MKDTTLNSRSEAVSQVVALTVQVYNKIGTFPPTPPDTELTRSQLRILMLLSQRENSVGAVGANLGMSLSSASRLVERLVDKGLVTRREHDVDRRVTMCLLTEKGLKTVMKLSEVRKERVRAVTDFLELGELLEVIHTMKLLDDAITLHRAKQSVIPELAESDQEK